MKASWIAARPQWNFASIGSTNSVQPYCRFAIIAMQTMPIASCSQRKYVASGGTGGADGCELNDMLLSSQGTLSISVRSVTRAAYWYAICQSASHSSGVAGLSMQRPWQHPLLGEKSGSASSRENRAPDGRWGYRQEYRQQPEMLRRSAFKAQNREDHHCG